MSRSPRVPAQTGTITELTPKGTGRFESEIGPVYVPYTVPGDRITAQIIKSTPNYAIGKLHRIVDPSKDRRTPICQHYGACGGCQLMHIPYNIQHQLKTNWLASAISAPLLPIITGQEFGIRNRVQLSVTGTNSHLNLGLNRFHSQTIQPLTNCPMTPAQISGLIPVITRWLRETHSTWCQVIIRIGTPCEDDPNCVVVLKGRPSRQDQAHITRTWRTLPISGLVMVLDETNTIELGQPFVFHKLHDIRHRVSWGAFFQGNLELTPRLLDTAIEMTSPTSSERGLDLFGGLGLFGIHLGKQSHSVTIVDTNTRAIDDAVSTIITHNLPNIQAKVGDANDIQSELSECDYLIVDPPRTGLSNSLKNRLNPFGPSRFTYVSCNPDTFARDLVDLTAYQCTHIQPIDMFPNMVHIELVARFERI